MKPNTRIALAGLLSAAGNLLNAFATEFGAEAPASPEAAATPEAPKRGRKPAAAAPAQPETPAEPAAPETPPVKETTVTQTEEDYQKLRAIIEPLVKGGQGEDVKKVIAKYATNNPPTLKGIDVKHHAAFEKDIAALAY